ncbi:MAG: family 10 glycosylhydrolase [Cyanobacteria bacterium]|nr:family 10 glycosylhydrolase [Cyanobacteriota bacterium]
MPRRLMPSRVFSAIAILLCTVLLVQMSFAGEPAQKPYSVITANASLSIDAKDIVRGGNSTVLYTPDYGPSTHTNPYGVEVVAVQDDTRAAAPSPWQSVYKVTQVNAIWDCEKRHQIDRCGNSTIPDNGVVLSASGDARTALLKELTVGQTFELKRQWFTQSSYPLSVSDPSPDNNPTASGFPGYRGSQQLVLYDTAYGKPRTGTNEFGFEVTVVDGVVVDQEAADSLIPPKGIAANSFVLSGHGKARDWLIANAPIGARVDITPEKSIKSQVDIWTYRYQLARRVEASQCQMSTPVCKDISLIQDQIGELQKNGQLEAAAEVADKALEKLNRYLWSTYPAFSPTAIRAAWHRPVEQSAEQVGRTLDTLKRSGINTVFLETVFHGYTIFPSDTYEHYQLPVQNPVFKVFQSDKKAPDKKLAADPLSVWVSQAHKRGMSLHAWFQVYYVGNKGLPGAPGPILSRYPQWANVQYSALPFPAVPESTSDKSTDSLKKTETAPAAPVDLSKAIPLTATLPVKPSTVESGSYFLDPANPEVKSFLLSLVDEMVTKYPEMDGIQLDYIRYPASFPPDRFSYLKTTWGYSAGARSAFISATGFDPVSFDKAGIKDAQKALWDLWIQYKTDQVTQFVQAASQVIHSKAPQMKRSAAIFPALEESLVKKHQDWSRWCQQGWLDFLAPMTLTSASKVVSEDTQRVVKLSGVPVISGVFGPFNNNSAEQVLDQIEAARAAGASGFSLFDTAHFTGRLTRALEVSQSQKGKTHSTGLNRAW